MYMYTLHFWKYFFTVLFFNSDKHNLLVPLLLHCLHGNCVCQHCILLHVSQPPPSSFTTGPHEYFVISKILFLFVPSRYLYIEEKSKNNSIYVFSYTFYCIHSNITLSSQNFLNTYYYPHHEGACTVEDTKSNNEMRFVCCSSRLHS